MMEEEELINLEHRKRTMLELFGDDSLPESTTTEEADDTTALDCDDSDHERKVSSHHACTSCHGATSGGVEDGCSMATDSEMQQRCCEKLSSAQAPSSASVCGGGPGGHEQQPPRERSERLQEGAVVKRARRVEPPGEAPSPNCKAASAAASPHLGRLLPSLRCSGMKGLDLLLEVARCVSESEQWLEKGPHREPAAGTPYPAAAPSTRNRLPVTAAAASLKDCHQASSRSGAGSTSAALAASGSGSAAGQKRKTGGAKDWAAPAPTPTPARKGVALKAGSCATTTQGLVPWERIKTGNRRYRLLSSMLC